MFMATLRLPTERITDWQSFHEVCQEVFGFPDFYGMNMDAWIDCMSYLYEDVGMTRVLLAEGEKMNIEIEAAEDFKARLPEVFSALRECSSFVNERYAQAGETPVLSLILL
jgi:RNAse (barnase) inhibitor barstar